MKQLHLVAITLSVGLLLNACGGGGGGGGQVAMDSMEPPAQSMPTVDTQTAFGTAGERPNVTPLRYRNLVTGLLQQDDPAFGSVAMNLYTPSLSSVRSAETTFTGDRFTLSVERQNGSGFTLDTNRHYTEVVNDDSTSTNLVSQRPFASGYIASVSGTRVAATGVSVEWSRTDPTDYLAGGYWLFFDGGVNAIEMGAFIDGTDYPADLTQALPVTGRPPITDVPGDCMWPQPDQTRCLLGHWS